MSQHPVSKVQEPDSPNRCQGVSQQGQCWNNVVPGTTFCPLHGGPNQANVNAKKELRNYRLTKWQDRIGEKANSTGIKDLRDEIGILRIILEERLEHCKSEMDLILHSGPIADLILKIEKVVASCHKLEGSMGQLLDKQAILQFASEIITIVGDTLGDDVTKIEYVSNQILALVGRMGTENAS
jgi:hypothetical protein